VIDAGDGVGEEIHTGNEVSVSAGVVVSVGVFVAKDANFDEWPAARFKATTERLVGRGYIIDLV
jgi:hypothetical protein